MTNLGNLPTELIGEIVHRVDSRDLFACTLINKKFHAVVNPILWHSIDIKNEAAFMQVMTGLVESDPPMGKHVRSLHLDNFVTDTQLLPFMIRVPYLENLTTEHAIYLTDISLQYLPSSCSKLKKLQLSFLIAITPPFVLALAQHCSQLSDLTVAGDNGLPCDSLLALTACPLKRLVIYLNGNYLDYDHDDDNDDDDDDDEVNLDGLAGFQHLQYLKIKMSPPHFTRKIISILTLHPDWLPHLTDFAISGCFGVTEQQATAFMKAHPALDSLSLTYNNFKDTYLTAIATYLPNIVGVALAMSHCFTAHGIRRLILACPMLKWVDLYVCYILVDQFPEADDWCLHDEHFLDHLDRNAIELVRLKGGDGFELDEEVLEEQQTRREFLMLLAQGRIILDSDEDEGPSSDEDEGPSSDEEEGLGGDEDDALGGDEDDALGGDDWQ